MLDAPKNKKEEQLINGGIKDRKEEITVAQFAFVLDQSACHMLEIFNLEESGRIQLLCSIM